MWNDVKYLLAYMSPLAAALGIWVGGIWSPGALYVGFVAIPVLELFLPASTTNTDAELEKSRGGRAFFDVLLYIHLPLVWGIAGLFAWRVGCTEISWIEALSMTISLGIVLGTNGINVAHEIGHRNGTFNVWVSRLLLVPSFYTHFTIEHNYGHHRFVGTPEDPATARHGESLYAFWWRSTIGSLINAWQLERKRLADGHIPFWSMGNQLIIGVVLEGCYLLVLVLIGGIAALPLVIAAGVIGFLLLETVNYIEHYGLLRRKLPSGQYEPVDAMHSWNSNHELGRIFLYELTRHADHHYHTSRKYQILRHLDGAPQLPTGYPGSMMLALIPVWWRRIMDPRIPGQMLRS
jgi:alkane 1-monooxygenase